MVNSVNKENPCSSQYSSQRTKFWLTSLTLQILKTLLENNANCFLKDSSCKTPLHLASERGNVRHVQVLAQAGQTCVSQLDEFKRTPLHYAVVNKHK